MRASSYRSVARGGGRNAFTLIEIMIVVSVMAIVMAAGIPAIFRSMKKDALRQAVADVMEACSHARAQAILQSVPSEFILRAEDGQILVRKVIPARMTVDPASPEEPGAGSRPTVFSAKLHPDIAIQLIYVNLQDQMDQPEVRVHFFPNGTSDEFTLILQSQQSSYKISLDVVTGLASVDKIK